MEDILRFADLAKKRQSDRKYKEQPVEKEKILQCLETARLSPSANNSQPWKFVVIDDYEKKELVAECTIGLGMNTFTHQCPVLVAVVLEKQNFMSSIGSIIKNKSLCNRTDITEEFLFQRFFPMIHHIVRSQAKSMQRIFHPSIQ